mmetsp:Transcript_26089/g.68590  ORF Transcript_26089/g.68590 Transcript_26089/m.68590 type:complete len:280 (+) Transcript_26089:774-1613(+)
MRHCFLNFLREMPGVVGRRKPKHDAGQLLLRSCRRRGGRLEGRVETCHDALPSAERDERNDAQVHGGWQERRAHVLLAGIMTEELVQVDHAQKQGHREPRNKHHDPHECPRQWSVPNHGHRGREEEDDDHHHRYPQNEPARPQFLREWRLGRQRHGQHLGEDQETADLPKPPRDRKERSHHTVFGWIRARQVPQQEWYGPSCCVGYHRDLHRDRAWVSQRNADQDDPHKLPHSLDAVLQQFLRYVASTKVSRKQEQPEVKQEQRQEDHEPHASFMPVEP